MTSLPYSAGQNSHLPQGLGSSTLLERLKELHPKSIDLSLGRIERLLAALGHPEQHLPPVVHVAGTNGKGSLIAFLRAIAEAQKVSGNKPILVTECGYLNRVENQGHPGVTEVAEAKYLPRLLFVILLME